MGDFQSNKKTEKSFSFSSQKLIPNKDVITYAKSAIFQGHEDKRFALCICQPKEVLNRDKGSIEEAYLRFRANVYIDQTHLLDDSCKSADGMELDLNDKRSTHFIIVENHIYYVAIFACMRVIVKNSIDEPLPIESFFPESFPIAAPQKSVEVSRFIVRHDKFRYSVIARNKLIQAGMAYAQSEELGPIYGSVEPSVERALLQMKLPIQRLTKLGTVPGFNGENIGIEISSVDFLMHLRDEDIEKMKVPNESYIYWGTISGE